MEIKLTKSEKATAPKEIQLGQFFQKAVSEENDAAQDQAAQLLSDTTRLKRIPILRCGTVSLQGYSEAIGEPGRQLKLIREPENKYDRWAIRVCTLDGVMLGYLPSRKNQSAARLMDAGKSITAFVDEAANMATLDPVREDPRLPIILYMDVNIPEER